MKTENITIEELEEYAVTRGLDRDWSNHFAHHMALMSLYMHRKELDQLVQTTMSNNGGATVTTTVTKTDSTDTLN